MWLARHCNDVVKKDSSKRKFRSRKGGPLAAPEKPVVIAIAPVGQTTDLASLVKVGTISSVKFDGTVLVRPCTDYPERFAPGAVLLLETARDLTEEITVKSSTITGETFKIELETLPTNLVVTPKARLYIRIEERIPAPKGMFYPDELAGMIVVTGDSLQAARVVRLEAETPCPYLVVEAGSLGELLIPFRVEFIETINPKSKTIRLKCPLSQFIAE